MIIENTDYLEKLKRGISETPSHFNRRYHFDLPAVPEQTQYWEYWRTRFANKNIIYFPAQTLTATADDMEGFSFANLQKLS